MDYIYVVYSSVTESYDNGLQSYRHLWARGSWGESVWGDFLDLTGDLIHIFDECVFPSVAAYTDDNFHLLYQLDVEPGLNIRGDEDPVTDNTITYMKVFRNELIPLDVEEAQEPVLSEDVSQNMPNPFTGKSYVNINLRQATSLSLEVTNMLGQIVYTVPERDFNSGSARLEIDGSDLTSGIYFYTVKAGETAITKKMIIE